MKNVLICIALTLLTSCATSSSVNDLEKRLSKDRSSVTELDTKIELLKVDREMLTKKLKTIATSGKSLSEEAKIIKDKIDVIDQYINTYNNIVIYLQDSMKKVSDQQSVQHSATAAALEENDALKMQADEEIRMLELEYAKKRKQALDEKSLDAPQGDDDGN